MILLGHLRHCEIIAIDQAQLAQPVFERDCKHRDRINTFTTTIQKVYIIYTAITQLHKRSGGS
jgi:hypothetical protein